MEIPNAKLLRIFVGELDKIHHKPLYEEIVYKAKEAGLAGATVMRGIMSYGTKNFMHTVKLLDFSEDLPVIIEIIDQEEKIDQFLVTVKDLLEKAGTGGLSTIENIKFISYPGRKK
jgi:uncharacterized protein